MEKLIEIIKNSLFFNENDYSGILSKYYIDGKSIKSMLKVDKISGWDLQKALNINKQLPILITDIFNGKFDSVVKSEFFIKFLNRLLFLFGYVDKFNMFRKNVKLKKMIFQFLGRGLSFDEIVTLCGFIFFNSSTPIVLAEMATANFDDELKNTIDEYNKFIQKIKDIGILKNITCTDCNNYYGISCYDSIKYNLTPFIIHLMIVNIDKIDSDRFNIYKNFIKGIKLKIISCSFKFKKFNDDAYLINMFNPYNKYIEKDVYSESVKLLISKIKQHTSDQLLEKINKRKIYFKNFPFKKD